MPILLGAHFHNEKAAYAYVEARLWPNGPTCPHCGGVERISAMKGKSTRIGTYKCYQCRKPFTVKVGTIFEASHVPMRHWLQAIFLMASSKMGISANQIHRTLGCTLKTAWFIEHRIREAMRQGSLAPFGGSGGAVEVDETYIGRLPGRDVILVDRHLGVLEKGTFKPNVALVLLAAKDPGRTIPGCRIRIQRFAGTEEGSGDSYSPIFGRYVEGNVVKLIIEASAVIEDYIFDVTWLSKEGRFVTTKEYPRWAWVECLVNACVHRSYSFSGTEITVKLFSDRMEVESPGGFVPPVTEQTIYATRASRNHHLMDALRHLGYVRMAREGTRRIRDSMKAEGLPDPVFRQEALHGVVVRVTLMNDHETRKRATDRDVAQFFGVEPSRHDARAVHYRSIRRNLELYG